MAIKRKISPRQATKENQLRLQTDNKSTKCSWILLMGKDVVIQNQRSGESSTGKVVLSRRAFNSLIDWYNKEQKLV